MHANQSPVASCQSSEPEDRRLLTEDFTDPP
jgi:hypothetical protein